MNTYKRAEKLDEASRGRAEQVIETLKNSPPDKERLYRIVSAVYLDGLIAGQSLGGNDHSRR